MVKIINIKVGILGLILGATIVILLNQKITELLQFLTGEWFIVGYVAWIAIVLSITVLAPISLTTQDTE